MKRLLAVVLAFLLLLPSVALAHQGRTDSSGGHHDRINGGYHYHHGHSAHQHPNGVCPYATPTPTPKPTATPRPTATPTPKPTATPSPTPIIYQDGRLKTTANLNMRKGPSTKNEVILTIPKDSVIPYVEEFNGWYKVYYSLTYGWVYGGYVQTVTPSPRPSTTLYVREYSKEEAADASIAEIAAAIAAVLLIPVGTLFFCKDRFR